MIEEARRRPGQLTLVTLGPLTNLAVAVLRAPAAEPQVTLEPAYEEAA
jgi:purine nucleosidase